MGLANLVPGISGGTMLLATGVYTGFITAIAEVTTLRFKPRSLVLLATIVGSAALAILLLAGFMRSLVIEQRWVMYSLFIGLTFGGVPLVWKLARPATPAVWMGAVGAFLAMVVMQLGFGAGGTGGDPSAFFLFLSGLAGASAMILPGVSGGYLLLLLGQYETILGAVDTFKDGLLGPDFSLILSASVLGIPVGIGVVAGVVGVSNLLRWLLDHHAKVTLGALLGLLLGAVVGLWPFQQPAEPALGSTIKGQLVSEATLPEIDPADWPLERFTPSVGQLAGSATILLLGLAATLAISRLGDEH
ncbi:MAG: DUF368 domain-containing protein [Acidobacteriota bacterium]|nr:DUF368 domain-containing protein [Acidobacteriota bacterium]